MRNLSLTAPLLPAEQLLQEPPVDSLDDDFARYCCHVMQQL